MNPTVEINKDMLKIASLFVSTEIIQTALQKVWLSNGYIWAADGYTGILIKDDRFTEMCDWSPVAIPVDMLAIAIKGMPKSLNMMEIEQVSETEHNLRSIPNVKFTYDPTERVPNIDVLLRPIQFEHSTTPAQFHWEYAAKFVKVQKILDEKFFKILPNPKPKQAARVYFPKNEDVIGVWMPLNATNNTAVYDDERAGLFDSPDMLRCPACEKIFTAADQEKEKTICPNSACKHEFKVSIDKKLTYTSPRILSDA